MRLTKARKAERLVKRAATAVLAAAKLAAKEKKMKAVGAAEAAARDKENVDLNASMMTHAAIAPTRYACTVVRQRGRAFVAAAKECLIEWRRQRLRRRSGCVECTRDAVHDHLSITSPFNQMKWKVSP